MVNAVCTGVIECFLGIHTMTCVLNVDLLSEFKIVSDASYVVFGRSSKYCTLGTIKCYLAHVRSTRYTSTNCLKSLLEEKGACVLDI